MPKLSKNDTYTQILIKQTDYLYLWLKLFDFKSDRTPPKKDLSLLLQIELWKGFVKPNVKLPLKKEVLSLHSNFLLFITKSSNFISNMNDNFYEASFEVYYSFVRQKLVNL